MKQKDVEKDFCVWFMNFFVQYLNPNKMQKCAIKNSHNNKKLTNCRHTSKKKNKQKVKA